MFNPVLDSCQCSVRKQCMSERDAARVSLLPYSLLRSLVTIKVPPNKRPIADLVYFLFLFIYFPLFINLYGCV